MPTWPLYGMPRYRGIKRLVGKTRFSERTRMIRNLFPLNIRITDTPCRKKLHNPFAGPAGINLSSRTLPVSGTLSCLIHVKDA